MTIDMTKDLEGIHAKGNAALDHVNDVINTVAHALSNVVDLAYEELTTKHSGPATSLLEEMDENLVKEHLCSSLITHLQAKQHYRVTQRLVSEVIKCAIESVG